jgi:hypothetical protein
MFVVYDESRHALNCKSGALRLYVARLPPPGFAVLVENVRGKTNSDKTVCPTDAFLKFDRISSHCHDLPSDRGLSVSLDQTDPRIV